MKKRFAHLSKLLTVGLFAASLGLAACTAPPTVAPTSIAATDSQTGVGPDAGYPGLQATVEVTGLGTGYPAPTDRPPTPIGAVPFVLTRPIVEGAVTVTGQGRPGVPIALHDVTFMGAPIAVTTVADDGTFSFTVPALERNHRLGVTIGDLTGTDWTPEEFLQDAYWGPGAQQLPQVGFYLDTELVKEP